MFDKNKNMPVSIIGGQAQSYIYEILNDINKLKILLVFFNKGFTWYRELRNLGIYSNLIEQTLNEFNNLGFIELKELNDLDLVQYESLKCIHPDMQSYFKIYFTNDRLYELIQPFEEDLKEIISRNPQLCEFELLVKEKFKPFVIKCQQIIQEESLQLERDVCLNGVSFKKKTKLSKEVQETLKLNSRKGTHLAQYEPKPLALMTPRERKRFTNKVFYNGREINSMILKEFEDYEHDLKHEIENSKDLVKINKDKYLVMDESKFSEFKKTNDDLKNLTLGEVFTKADDFVEGLEYLNKLKEEK